MNESLLGAIASARRAVAELEAVETGLLAMALAEALAGRAPGSGSDMPVRALATELSAELRMGDRAIQRRLDEAHRVTTSFPATYDSFCAGRISRSHVSTIVDAGLRIDDPEARAAYEERSSRSRSASPPGACGAWRSASRSKCCRARSTSGIATPPRRAECGSPTSTTG